MFYGPMDGAFDLRSLWLRGERKTIAKKPCKWLSHGRVKRRGREVVTPGAKSLGDCRSVQAQSSILPAFSDVLLALPAPLCIAGNARLSRAIGLITLGTASTGAKGAMEVKKSAFSSIQTLNGSRAHEAPARVAILIIAFNH